MLLFLDFLIGLQDFELIEEVDKHDNQQNNGHNKAKQTQVPSKRECSVFDDGEKNQITINSIKSSQ